MALTEHDKWSGKTDGTPTMQRVLIWIIRHISIRVPYAIMVLVVPFYMLIKRKEYKAIYDLMRVRIGCGKWKSFVNTYKTHIAFGKVVIDRFAAYAGRKFNFTIQDTEIFDQLSDSNQSFLMLSSHIGCYEMVGYTMHSKKRLNAIVYAGETEIVMSNRQKQFSNNNINMIKVSDNMSHLFEINAAINNGEIVSLPADRLFGSQKKITCDFFNAKANFPAGPFTIARAKNLKMIAVFALKTKTYSYHIVMKEVNNAQQYADVVEEIVRQYPSQWFNFFDFWTQ